jgi:hypothetical protein
MAWFPPLFVLTLAAGLIFGVVLLGQFVYRRFAPRVAIPPAPEGGPPA